MSPSCTARQIEQDTEIYIKMYVRDSALDFNYVSARLRNTVEDITWAAAEMDVRTSVRRPMSP